jgi:hypothetical protein
MFVPHRHKNSIPGPDDLRFLKIAARLASVPQSHADLPPNGTLQSKRADMTDHFDVRATTSGVSPMRDRIALGLMSLMSLGSLYVFMDSLLTFVSIPPSAVAVEAWRIFGYIVFAGLFLLAGVLPRTAPGIWELIIFHKAATALYLIPYIGIDTGTGTTATKTILNIVLTDFLLVALTAISYALTKGWQAWRLRRPLSPRLGR